MHLNINTLATNSITNLSNIFLTKMKYSTTLHYTLSQLKCVWLSFKYYQFLKYSILRCFSFPSSASTIHLPSYEIQHRNSVHSLYLFCLRFIDYFIKRNIKKVVFLTKHIQIFANGTSKTEPVLAKIIIIHLKTTFFFFGKSMFACRTIAYS